MTETGLPPDEAVEAFVDRHVTSFAAWDMLVLLHSRPELSESPKEFAHRLGRPEPDVADAAARLAADGLLVETSQGDDPSYRLTDDRGQLDTLARFAMLAAQREWRLELVRRVLTRTG